MFRQIADFSAAWNEETKMTLLIFNALTNDSLAKEVHPHVRTLGRIAWHITQTLTEMPHKAGLLPTDDLHGKPLPQTVEQLVAAYTQYAEAVANAVVNNWSDNDLATTIPMYGETWTKGTTLHILIGHQAHHRAQMTVIMRLLGLKVPGIYGPAQEEWSAWGMEPPSV